MDKLAVQLENCYGIEKIQHEFDFDSCRANLIYAPNGVMKTSFAKSFLQISNGLEPEEKVFNKESSFDIKIDGVDIDKDEIFVIEPFNEQFESKNISTLLVNGEKKDRYDLIYKDILTIKSKVIVFLNKVSKLKKDDIEKQINSDMNCDNFFSSLEKIRDYDEDSNDYSNVPYKVVFDPKVIELLKDDSIRGNISEYTEKYNELVDSSNLYKKGVFSPAKAESISASLKKEKYFEAEHSILLNGSTEAFRDYEKLQETIEKEKDEIFNNKELKEISNKISKGVAAIKVFQDLLELAPEIAVDLADIETLRVHIWKSYFSSNKELFIELLDTFNAGKHEMAQIENEALSEKTQWDEAQSIFKERFYVPFTIDIEERENVVLGTAAPNVVFKFDDGNGNVELFNRGGLNSLNVLSQGERRALYLLYIIFEFKARLLRGQKTIIIIDDVADSFDYKNKYAIIEYLKEMSEEPLFGMIVLTHNFDFYRTFQERILNNKWKKSFVAQRENGEIRLLLGGSKNIVNPFGEWKSKISNNNSMLVSIIPFIRNLIEFKDGSNCENYKKLTSMLHVKADTLALTLEDLNPIILSCITNGLPEERDKSIRIIDLIYDTANLIVDDICSDEIKLEYKICLSIAIRLKAEVYMWSKVVDKTEINRNQTGVLFKRFQNECGNDVDFARAKKILSQVSLMTPENIHLNSFMYEPLVDLSIRHLVKLYTDLKGL
ncbi:Uncharacterised protein [BD1-7 clade bacterium]|uniref:Protein CR006 P-loop domain-containing protein n=1 Tax=BD1-7 clade bacterium TaxID=2029982 RepID=A0A5S9NXA3_9GAMM|nr:Uncharacterised protein [BD1-7 clade bacterium]CAA0095885.1 Uncharacterised protein [BD1-7 clade bacterium]